MNVTDTLSLPYGEAGGDLKRKIRLAVSPQTTGEARFDLVHCDIPPLGISNGHTHDESDEYIVFLSPGEAVLGEETFAVPRMGIVHARPGAFHECRNTSADQNLELVCFFIGPFAPYGVYPELIRRTAEYLSHTE